MANYVIGDVQGCLDTLEHLLETINYQPGRDTLWFAGDLINRGPKSRGTLLRLIELGDDVRAVLGNHDLHLLARWAGHGRTHKSDTIDEIMDAPDAAELVNWLRQQPLVRELPVSAQRHRRLMVHAGILPQWSFDQALEYSKEFQMAMASPKWLEFMAELYGNKPSMWSKNLLGFDRLRLIVNVCTRLRMLDDKGALDFKYKGAPELAPSNLTAWVNVPRQMEDEQIYFGHWSTLGCTRTPVGQCLDSGCVWGGQMTALCLENNTLTQVDSID